MDQVLLNRAFRADYMGEEIHTQVTRKNSQWNFETEFIPNAITNTQISNRAVILGNGKSREFFPIGRLQGHRGGYLGAGAVQTYGCNALYRDFTPHFLVATGKEIVDEIANSGYCDDHIVYANGEHLLDYPGKFYLVPGNPHLNAGTLAAYIAAFDGHKQIYLMGFDGGDGGNFHNNVYSDTPCYESTETRNLSEYWSTTMESVMQVYPDVEFIRVMPTARYVQPTGWLNRSNYRQIDFKAFVAEIDL